MYSPTSNPNINSPVMWIDTTGSTIPTPMFITQAAFPITTGTGWTAQQHMQALYNAQQPQTTVVEVVPQHIKLQLGKHRTITFPDGTVIDFFEDGRYMINDANAKVVYKANRVHDFNPFINASDKLEAFIKYCGTVGVRQGDMLGIPIKHFIAWLVIEAAKADGEEPTDTLMLTDQSKPRCRTCGRFMSPQLKADRIEFCRPICLETKLNRSNKNGYQSTSKTPRKVLEARAETGASAPETASAALGA